MTTRPLHLGLLLAALALALIACAGEEDAPPCMPLEGETGDPCEGDAGASLAQFSAAYSNVRSSRFFGDEPLPIRWHLGTGRLVRTGHIVVRGQFLPHTLRCSHHQGSRHYYTPTVIDVWVLKCYADIQALEYVVGSGPPTLTAVVVETNRDPPPVDPETVRAEVERDLISQGNLALSEAVLFLGPALEASVESWQVYTAWDLERQEDGTVIAVHPDRAYWQRQDDYETQYRSQVEMTLADFRDAAQSAHSDRLTDYDGRVGEDADDPMVVTDAAQLHTFYVEIGAVDHPAGPPATQPPPITCGLVQNNADLLADCEALLPTRDTLQGTAALNWNKGHPIDLWDGVTAEGTPRRITKLELPSTSLTGSIPAGLGSVTGLTHLDLSGNVLTGTIPVELGLLQHLDVLQLSGNSLTGCIPVSLQGVPTNDLDDLGLPDCAG